MKKILLLTTVILFTSIGLMSQSKKEARYLKPTNFTKRVTTVIAEKKRSYYSLNLEEPSVINVQGPGILRVVTRGRFVPDESENISYEILYTIDGGKNDKIKIKNAARSKKATYQNGTLGTPGQLRDYEIVLGRGHHTIEFLLSENKYAVAARYKFTPGKNKKQEWITYSPLQPSEPVDLIAREQSVHYYRFSMEKPLQIEINGPTQLRILTRIENHFNMKGRIHYRIQVKEKGDIINTYQLNSRHSEVAVYKNDKTLIPGKACEFVITVPRGRHTYEILPLDKDKTTLLGRCLLPKKDVKLSD